MFDKSLVTPWGVRHINNATGDVTDWIVQDPIPDEQFVLLQRWLLWTRSEVAVPLAQALLIIAPSWLWMRHCLNTGVPIAACLSVLVVTVPAVHHMIRRTEVPPLGRDISVLRLRCRYPKCSGHHALNQVLAAGVLPPTTAHMVRLLVAQHMDRQHDPCSPADEAFAAQIQQVLAGVCAARTIPETLADGEA